MFLNVPFSVLSESYSHHSYTSQYFPIAIVTACEEGTAEQLQTEPKLPTRLDLCLSLSYIKQLV